MAINGEMKYVEDDDVRTMQQHARHQRAETEGSWRKKSSNSSYKRHSSYSNGSSDMDLPTSFVSRSQRNYDKPKRQDYEDLESKVQDHFRKRFSFLPPLQDWTLPEPSRMFVDDQWKDDILQGLKKKLNEVKSKLDGYNLNDWHKHTRAMNKAGEIQWRLRGEVNPEFITQAWCKFYENAMSFNLVPPIVVNTGTLNSVHLCEAPGAFITSLNHYLKQHNPDIEWNWRASTLNPYYEGNPLSCMINDDRFILQTLNHWTFGLDYTGNLMDIDNMLHLVKEAAEMGDVLLVTADGSIDCQEDPGEQESIVSSLHYCEAVTALHILGEGGSFLLKMFTMYEHETVCLMYLLCCSFKSVHVSKPATSKEGNSEVYVVCLEYRGRNSMEPWLEVLRKYFGPDLPRKALFPFESIPITFLNQLRDCANTFKNYQIDVIETNIRVYEEKSWRNEKFFIKKLRSSIANHFMDVYDMKKLEECDEVVGKSTLKKTMTLNMDPREEEGSFEDRRKKATLPPLKLLEVLEKELNNMNVKWPFEGNVKQLEFPVCVDGFKIQTGKPIKTVQSSKFCLGRLLKIRNQVRSIARKDFHLSSSMQNNGLPSPDVKSDKVTESLDQNSPLSQIITEQYPKMKFKILNYKEKLWTSMEGGNNEAAEINAFVDIMEIIDTLWREQNLLVQGYPMLTQFNVGIIYMLCHLFDAVDFVKPIKQDFAVVFKGFRKWNPMMRKFLDSVDETIERLEDEGGHQTVLSLFPINRLCERYSSPEKEEEKSSDRENGDGQSEKLEICDNLFYECVTEVNNLCVKEQVSDIIANILVQHECDGINNSCT